MRDVYEVPWIREDIELPYLRCERYAVAAGRQEAADDRVLGARLTPELWMPAGLHVDVNSQRLRSPEPFDDMRDVFGGGHLAKEERHIRPEHGRVQRDRAPSRADVKNFHSG